MIQLRERNPLLDHAWGISLAEDRVWAQISGFAPSTKPWKRLLVVLQACIDDSYSSRTGLFVLGGAIAPVEAWAAFSRDWEQILHFARLNKNGKRVFKISEMRDSPDFPVFYRTAKDHVLAIISLRFYVHDLESAKRRITIPNVSIDWNGFNNNFLFAFSNLMKIPSYGKTKYRRLAWLFRKAYVKLLSGGEDVIIANEPPP